MPINYAVKKKVYKHGKEPKELYFAVPKALQSRGNGVDEHDLALEMEQISALSAGDALSALELMSRCIARNLCDGRTVTIRGLGTFFVGLSSEGVPTPEECTADKVKVTRVCYKADKAMANKVKDATFVSVELKAGKK